MSLAAGATMSEVSRNRELILAVDGGASKADLALVSADGVLVAIARCRGSFHFGLDRSQPIEAMDAALRALWSGARLAAGRRLPASIGVYCVAGADLPIDDRRISRAIGKRGWSVRTLVRNDTFAILRAGSDRNWGIAVVCGAGMNCVGIGPGGRTVRFPSLGDLSGDQAHGGAWLGLRALGMAIRARDGRGARTLLEQLVPERFKLPSPRAVMEAVYTRRLESDRLSELAPAVFTAASESDSVAQQLVDELADEIVVTVAAAVRRLRVADRDVHVVLGGGVLQGGHTLFLRRIQRGIEAKAPKAVLRILDSPPVLGAALIGLDAANAGPAAYKRLRRALTTRRLTARPTQA
ncbi:MAG: N-acetylglucosamine kinase [Candidatus Dormibacterales bacterium]